MVVASDPKHRLMRSERSYPKCAQGAGSTAAEAEEGTGAKQLKWKEQRARPSVLMWVTQVRDCHHSSQLPQNLGAGTTSMRHFAVGEKNLSSLPSLLRGFLELLPAANKQHDVALQTFYGWSAARQASRTGGR